MKRKDNLNYFGLTFAISVKASKKDREKKNAIVNVFMSNLRMLQSHEWMRK